LHTDIHISLKEALLGFNRDIKHLDDHLVTIKRDSIIQPGEVLRIKGEGMPKHQSSEKGDLFVKVHVIFPTNLTEKQIESNNINILNVFWVIQLGSSFFVSLLFNNFTFSCENFVCQKILLVDKPLTEKFLFFD